MVMVVFSRLELYVFCVFTPTEICDYSHIPTCRTITRVYTPIIVYDYTLIPLYRTILLFCLSVPF